MALVMSALAAGADVLAWNSGALIMSSGNGHAEIVKELLDRETSRYGLNTSLCHAARNGHVDVVILLLDAGADVHADNDTPILWASENRMHHNYRAVLDVLELHASRLQESLKVV